MCANEVRVSGQASFTHKLRAVTRQGSFGELSALRKLRI